MVGTLEALIPTVLLSFSLSLFFSLPSSLPASLPPSPSTCRCPGAWPATPLLPDTPRQTGNDTVDPEIGASSLRPLYSTSCPPHLADPSLKVSIRIPIFTPAQSPHLTQSHWPLWLPSPCCCQRQVPSQPHTWFSLRLPDTAGFQPSPAQAGSLSP